MELAHQLEKRTFYVYTASAYCSYDCFPVIHGELVYRDTSHFTITFSEKVLSPLFGRLLDEVTRNGAKVHADSLSSVS